MYIVLVTVHGAPSDMARKTCKRKWFHFGQRYGTVRNDTHGYGALRRVASRRVASRSLTSPLSCSPDKKNEVGFVRSFFSPYLSCSRALRLITCAASLSRIEPHVQRVTQSQTDTCQRVEQGFMKTDKV